SAPWQRMPEVASEEEFLGFDQKVPCVSRAPQTTRDGRVSLGTADHEGFRLLLRSMPRTGHNPHRRERRRQPLDLLSPSRTLERNPRPLPRCGASLRNGRTPEKVSQEMDQALRLRWRTMRTCSYGDKYFWCDKPATKEVVIHEWMDDHTEDFDTQVCDEHY